nr:hypothetical protein [Bradyrhizobium sp. CCBAU 11361]
MKVSLPEKEHDASEWRTAMEALLLVDERGGLTIFARIGVMRALNRHDVPKLNPKGKKPYWGRSSFSGWTPHDYHF